MITIKFKNDNIDIKNSVKELTISEFEDILNVLKSEDNIIDKWFDIFKYLGFTDEIINNINLDEFKQLIREFDFNTTSTKIKKSFKINGVEYKAYDFKFKLTVKKIILIEDYLILNPYKYIGEVIAILYTNDKEGELTNKLIKEKATLIREHVKADIAVPIINLIAITFFQNLNTKINE